MSSIQGYMMVSVTIRIKNHVFNNGDKYPYYSTDTRIDDCDNCYKTYYKYIDDKNIEYELESDYIVEVPEDYETEHISVDDAIEAKLDDTKDFRKAYEEIFGFDVLKHEPNEYQEPSEENE